MRLLLSERTLVGGRLWSLSLIPKDFDEAHEAEFWRWACQETAGATVTEATA